LSPIVPSPSLSTSSPVAPLPSSLSSVVILVALRHSLRRRIPLRCRLSPVECLCRRATAADARDNVTTTTTVVLRIFLASAANDGEHGTGGGDGGAGRGLLVDAAAAAGGGEGRRRRWGDYLSMSCVEV
jgi:hypothetical protein